MCPRCKSPDVRHSRTRHFSDPMMRWAGLVPYRCRECSRRFYVNRYIDGKLRRDRQREQQLHPPA